MKTKSHVRGDRAPGGGFWYFPLCGSRNWKAREVKFVAPANADCKKCQLMVRKTFAEVLRKGKDG